MWHNKYLASIWSKYGWVNEQPGNVHSSWISRIFVLLATVFSIVLGVFLFTQENTYADAQYRSVSSTSPVRIKDIVLCPAEYSEIRFDTTKCGIDNTCPELDPKTQRIYDAGYKYLAFYNWFMIDHLGMNIGEVDQLAELIRAQSEISFSTTKKYLTKTAALSDAQANDLLMSPKMLKLVKSCVVEGDCTKETLWLTIIHSGAYNGSFVDRSLSGSTGKHIHANCRFMNDIPCDAAVRAIWVNNRYCMAWLWDSYDFLSTSQYHEFGFGSLGSIGALDRFAIAVWRGHAEFELIEWEKFRMPDYALQTGNQWFQVAARDSYSAALILDQPEGRPTVCQPSTVIFANFSSCKPTTRNTYWLYQDSSYIQMDESTNYVYSGLITRTQILTLTTKAIYSQLELFEMLGGLVGITQGFTGWQAILLAGALLFNRGQNISTMMKMMKYSFYVLCMMGTAALIGTLLVIDLTDYTSAESKLVNMFSIIGSDEVPMPNVVLKHSSYGFQWINTTKLLEHNVSLPLLQYMYVASYIQFYYPGFVQISLFNETTNQTDNNWASNPTSEEYQYIYALTRLETLHWIPRLEQEYKQLARKFNMNPDDPAEELLLSFFMDTCQIVKECTLSGDQITNCCGRFRYVLWGNTGNVITLRLNNELLEPKHQQFNGAGPENSFIMKVDIKPILKYADILRYGGPKLHQRQVPHNDCGGRCRTKEYMMEVYLENPKYENPLSKGLASYEDHFMYSWDEVWPGKRLKFKLDVSYSQFIDNPDYKCNMNVTDKCRQYPQWMYSLRNLVISAKCGCKVCMKALKHIPKMRDNCCTPAAAVKCILDPSMFTMFYRPDGSQNPRPMSVIAENWSGGNLIAAMTTPGTTNFSSFVKMEDMNTINCNKDIPACERFVFTTASTEVVDNPEDTEHWVVDIYLGTDNIKANVQSLRGTDVLEIVGIVLCGVGFMFGFSLPSFFAAIVSFILQTTVKVPPMKESDTSEGSTVTEVMQDRWEQMTNPVIDHWKRFMVIKPEESSKVRPFVDQNQNHHVEELPRPERITGVVEGRAISVISIREELTNPSNIVKTKKPAISMASVGRKVIAERRKARDQLKSSVMGMILVILTICGVSIAGYMVSSQLKEIEFDQKPLLNTDKLPIPSVAICAAASKLSKGAMLALLKKSTCVKRDSTGKLSSPESCDLMFSILFTSSQQQCALMDNTQKFVVAKQHETIVKIEIDNQSPIEASWMGDARDMSVQRFGSNFDWKQHTNVDVEYNAETWSLKDGSCEQVQASTTCSKCAHSTDGDFCCLEGAGSSQVYDYGRKSTRLPCERASYGYEVCVPGRRYGARLACPAPGFNATRRYLSMSLQTNVMYAMVKRKRHSLIIQLCLAGGFVDLFLGISIMSAVYGVVYLVYRGVKKLFGPTVQVV